MSSNRHPTDTANTRFVIGCSHREVNNRNPKLANLPKRAPDDQQQMRMQEGLDYEEEIFRDLSRLHKAASMRDHHDSEAATLSAMKRGDLVIIGPSLPTINHRSGKPDVLVRHGDSPMANGNWAYLPVDVKHSKALESKNKPQPFMVSSLEEPWLHSAVSTDLGEGKPDTEHSLQLAHYWLMLTDLGIAPDIDPVGAVIDKSRAVVWRALDDPKNSFIRKSLQEWESRWAAIDAMLSGDEPLTRAVYKQECFDCVWHDVCEDQLVEEQHVSLVQGITPTVVEKLLQIGFEKIPQLASLDHATIEADDDLKKIKSLPEYIDSCRVYLNGGRYPFIKRNGHLPSVTRADVEIDFDIENDDIVYLYGNYVTHRQPDGTYNDGEFVSFHSFDRSDPDREGILLASFWKWLHDMVNDTTAAGKTIAVYCYSGVSAEIPRMKRAAERNVHVAGVPSPDEVLNLVNQPWWVDLRDIVKELHWPVRGLGLKYVAPLSGFAWDAEDAGGANSMAWYKQACQPDDPEAATLQQKLLRYNEDDVQATKHLRQWLHDGVTGQTWTLQSVTTLVPPQG